MAIDRKFRIEESWHDAMDVGYDEFIDSFGQYARTPYVYRFASEEYPVLRDILTGQMVIIVVWSGDFDIIDVETGNA